MLISAAREGAFKNAKTSENSENSKNGKNKDKGENLGINLVQVPYI